MHTDKKQRRCLWGYRDTGGHYGIPIYIKQFLALLDRAAEVKQEEHHNEPKS